MTPAFTVRTTALLTLLLLPVALQSQQSPQSVNAADSAKRATALRPVTVTATRRATDVHEVAAPVSVVDSAAIRERTPTNPADLLRELPGVDVIGVGPNQNRPSIRGQRGQRILLLEDGMRLNNSRRQQDFGELPSLVDVLALDRIEVVRGPASVLYGTDAIGGVINLITTVPQRGTATRGRLGYQYGDAGSLGKAFGAVSGSKQGFSWQLGGSARRAGNYAAPAGTFGNLKLANDVTVLDAGVKDQSATGYLGWQGSAHTSAFAKVEQYKAQDAGFGYVPNKQLGGDDTKIQILYPRQTFQKLTVGGALTNVGLGIADRIDLTAYTQRNRRNLAQDIFIPFGPGTPTGAGVAIQTGNYTDLATVGARVEASRVLRRTVLTWGADAFQDRSFNTDTSTQTVFGFGPPSPRGTNKSSVPNAVQSSIGGFVQASLSVVERATVTLGGRVQQVRSAPRFTPGVTTPLAGHSNSTGVYSVNTLYRLTDDINLVGSVGTGFRAPNLVERYFDGPTPEGSAYQTASPDLKPERSFNTDLGLKFRRGRVMTDLAVFDNTISDGIVAAPTGATKNRQPVYQNVNVGKLRTRGGEIDATLLLDRGFSIRGNWSTIKSTNVLDPNSPIGSTFSSKLNVAAGWRVGRGWIEYAVRRNGEQKDIAVGASPVGNSLPAFTVHAVRGGIRGWVVGGVRQDITLAVNNLTNALYAEAANSSFFRPEPKRNFSVAVVTSF